MNSETPRMTMTIDARAFFARTPRGRARGEAGDDVDAHARRALGGDAKMRW
jgi:hypothetical protein